MARLTREEAASNLDQAADLIHQVWRGSAHLFKGAEQAMFKSSLEDAMAICTDYVSDLEHDEDGE